MKIDRVFKCFMVVFGILGASAMYADSEKNDMIFWLRKPLLFPENSTQYLQLPFPGGEELYKIKNFKYNLDLPKGFELITDCPRISIGGYACENPRCLVYPEKIDVVKHDNGTKYVLHYSGIGATGIGIWLTELRRGDSALVIGFNGTDGWSDFKGYYTSQEAESTGRFTIFIKRWIYEYSPEALQKRFDETRGIIDIDDIIIKERGASQSVYEMHFDNGSNEGLKLTDGLSVVKENENYFIRADISSDKIGHSTVQGKITVTKPLKPGITYEITCRARSLVSKTPDNYVFSPVFIKHCGQIEKKSAIKAYYEYDIDNGKKTGTTDSLDIKLLSDGSVKTPEKLDVAIWGQAEEALMLQAPETTDIFINTICGSGIKTFLTDLRDSPWRPQYNNNPMFAEPLSEILHRKGMRIIPYINTFYLGIGTKQYGEKNPDTNAINANGRALNFNDDPEILTHAWTSVCPSHLISGNCVYWNVYLDFLKKKAIANHWAGLFWDFEISDIIATNTKSLDRIRCFCPVCIAEFKKFSGINNLPELPADKLAQYILTNYQLEWLKYRGAQYGKMYKTMIDAVREVNPEAVFCLYSGSYTFGSYSGKGQYPFRSCEKYGVYPPMAGKYIDVFFDHHFPMTGQQGRVEMQLMRQALQSQTTTKKKIYNTATNSMHGETVKLIKNHILSAVAYTEADGIQIYQWMHIFDSQGWSRLRETVELLANLEDYFIYGTRMDYLATVDNKNIRFSAWVKGENRIVFVFNDTPEGQHVSVSNYFAVNSPISRFTAKDYETGKTYGDPSKIILDIQPFDTAVIIISAR